MDERELTWRESEMVALCLGALLGAVRTWRNRWKIPARWELALTKHLGAPIFLIDRPRGAHSLARTVQRKMKAWGPDSGPLVAKGGPS
jgi:hypothetical protein